jgi:LGFP repeat
LTDTDERRKSEFMRTIAYRNTAAVGLAVIALTAVGCSNGRSVDASTPPQVGLIATSETEAPPTDVKLIGERDVEVTLTGPIAAKYASATEYQRQALGKPLTGDRNAGARESGVVFQQFQGGVITAKNGEAGTPGYITWGKIREAWNVQRNLAGVPEVTGENGSVGPLGAPTSDENSVGDLLVTTFEHGKIAYDATTDQVEVTVNGAVVPSGL